MDVLRDFVINRRQTIGSSICLRPTSPYKLHVGFCDNEFLKSNTESFRVMVF